MNAAIKALNETLFIRRLQLRELDHMPDDKPRCAALECDIEELGKGIAIIEKSMSEQGKAGAQC